MFLKNEKSWGEREEGP